MRKILVGILVNLFAVGAFALAPLPKKGECVGDDLPPPTIPSPNFTKVYLQDDFESGNFDKWHTVNKKVVITDTVAYGGKKAVHIPYDMPAGGNAHKDQNRFFQYTVCKERLRHFVVSGCYMIKSTTAPVSQRKLFYLFSEPFISPNRWTLVLASWGGVKDAKGNITPMSLTLAGNETTRKPESLRYPISKIAVGKLSYDKWHCLDLKVKLNSPGLADGMVEVWVDGKKEASKANLYLRDGAASLGRVRIGNQIDRNGDNGERHEDRYWDNVRISSW